jgi:hypothetical protein
MEQPQEITHAILKELIGALLGRSVSQEMVGDPFNLMSKAALFFQASGFFGEE